MVRKKPVRHGVKSHEKKNGTHVQNYARGSGARSQRPSRVVGASRGKIPDKLYDDSVSLELHGHVEDLINLFKDLGYSVRSLSRAEFHEKFSDYGEPSSVDEWYDASMQEKVNGVGVGFYMANPVLLSKNGVPVKIVDLTFP